LASRVEHLDVEAAAEGGQLCGLAPQEKRSGMYAAGKGFTIGLIPPWHRSACAVYCDLRVV